MQRADPLDTDNEIYKARVRTRVHVQSEDPNCYVN